MKSKNLLCTTAILLGMFTGLRTAHAESDPFETKAMLTGFSLGLGVGLIGAIGVPALMLDGDSQSASDDSRQTFDTKTLGYASIGVGLLLVGVGATLWLTDDAGEEEGIAISAAPTSDGLAVGLSGRF